MILMILNNAENYLKENNINYWKTFLVVTIAAIGLFCIFYFWSPKTSISNDSSQIKDIKKIEQEVGTLVTKIKDLDKKNSQLDKKINTNAATQTARIKKIITTNVKGESSDEAIRNFTASW